MVISAINALTLSPALCAVLLKPGGHRPRGPVGCMLAGIDKMTAGYAWIVRKLVRISVLSIVLLVGVFALTGGIFSVTPQGFLPEEEQGAMFAVLQIPEGASLNRTSDVTRAIEEILLADPAVAPVIAVIGLNFLMSEERRVGKECVSTGRFRG